MTDSHMRFGIRLHRAAFLATMIVSLTTSVSRADAQTQTQPAAQEPRGPFRELFGRPRRETGQSLTFSLAGYGGYDTNVIGDQSVQNTDPRAQQGASSLIGADAGLQYSKTERRASFAASVSGSYRYFPAASALSQEALNAGVGSVFQVGHRTRLRLDESFGYQPYYQLGLFPGFGAPELGAAIPSNLDFVVLKRQSIISTTSGSLEQQLTRRSTLTIDGQFYTQTLAQPTNLPIVPTDDTTGTTPSTTTTTTTTATGGQDDVRGYTGGIHFSRQLTRYLTLRLGDEYRHFEYPAPTRRVLQGNNIDAGLDYSRSLPFSRRTSFSISSGSAIVSIDGRQYANLTGSASLIHLFSRNWQGSLAYNRDMSFVQTLNQPLFGDSASASLQGIFHRRFLMVISGGYMSGRLGYSKQETDSSTLRTGTGAFSLAYAITDYLRANFDYTYFSYHFSNNALLPEGLRPSFDRNSLRGGLSLLLPLIR